MKKTGLNSMPNFLIGGTSAGGTSFLSAILIQHPEIYLPKKMRPEPHYFYKSWEFKKGLEYYQSEWFNSVKDGHVAIGERSSSYLFGGQFVAKRIFSAFPNMRLIFTLRDPVERAWANYRYTVLEGIETLSFEEALIQEQERILKQKGIWSEIQPFNYTGRGYYARQISEFLRYFPKENILLIKSENLSKETSVELKKICNFLNISDNFSYSSVPPHTSVNVVDLKLQANLRKYFKHEFDTVIEMIRRNEQFENFTNEKNQLEKMKQLSNNLENKKRNVPEFCKEFMDNLYKKDLEQLSLIVDFDISDWL